MSQELTIPQSAPAYLTEFVKDNLQQASTLSAGIQSSFQSISIKGSKWRIRSGDDEVPIVDPVNQMPVPFIHVVIIAANTRLSKTWYEHQFQDGSYAAPDCASATGVSPDPGVTNPQSAHCQTCPKNQWGSAISKASGKAIKACQDSKRLAVVAEGAYDTVYLLNVPAASLQPMRNYADALGKRGRPFNGVVTRMSFDVSASFPLLKFQYIRDLTEAEFQSVLEKSTESTTDAIIGEVGQQAYSVPAAQPVPAAVPMQVPVTQSSPVQVPATPPIQGGFGMPAAPVSKPVQKAAASAGFGAPNLSTPVTQPAQTVPQVPANVMSIDVDADGVAWNEELHASTKTKTADGKWKKRRGAASFGASPVPTAQPAQGGFGVPAPTAPKPVQQAPAPITSGLDDLDSALDNLGL